MFGKLGLAAAVLGVVPAFASARSHVAIGVGIAPERLATAVVVDAPSDQRVWVEPTYRTVHERVWVDAVTQDQCTRVWAPPCYEDRLFGYGRHSHREHVLVAPGHYEIRHEAIVITPGHYDDVIRQQVAVPGHWEDRCDAPRVVEVHPEPRPVPFFGFVGRIHF